MSSSFPLAQCVHTQSSKSLKKKLNEKNAYFDSGPCQGESQWWQNDKYKNKRRVFVAWFARIHGVSPKHELNQRHDNEYHDAYPQSGRYEASCASCSSGDIFGNFGFFWVFVHGISLVELPCPFHHKSPRKSPPRCPSQHQRSCRGGMAGNWQVGQRES